MKLKFDRNYQTFFIKNEKKNKEPRCAVKQVLFAKNTFHFPESFNKNQSNYKIKKKSWNIVIFNNFNVTLLMIAMQVGDGHLI